MDSAAYYLATGTSSGRLSWRRATAAGPALPLADIRAAFAPQLEMRDLLTLVRDLGLAELRGGGQAEVSGADAVRLIEDLERRFGRRLYRLDEAARRPSRP